ncbi:MAG: NADH-quinone oxidoreductase subunit J, partial [Dehalococcoidia bacterium]|nr:NADH-quinone oxidoreductase subunit J [Dehalococcoidia bacterium]
MGLDIAFWVLAVVSVGAALAVVLLHDIFRAALFLVLCFFTVAGIYITLSADFLAGAQVLIYVGAIGVLILFAIMLTRESRRGSPSGRLRLPALLVGLLFLVTMVFVVVSTDWHVTAELP